MQVVSQDDINMYARGLIGRKGQWALDYARDRSRRLAAIQDEEGAKVWDRVAEAVAGRIQDRARG